MRIWWAASAVLTTSLGLVAAASSAHADEMSGSLREMIAQHRCDVVARLETVYEHGDGSSQHDRYLIVGRPRHDRSFVQCIFYQQRTRVLCEASSGFFSPKGAERFQLSKTAVAELGRLGFSTDASKGNYRLDAAAAPPDFNALADLMLKALHNAYDARASEVLQYSAPLAPRLVTSCIPLS